ncbi:hypothetical protein KY329_04775 [Candidatus Woesearchaeota archaeon]|nr:hypothetical protein [Candidatus Woesearchaeota archaeon]
MSEDMTLIERLALQLNGDLGRSRSSGEAIAKARQADPLVDIMLDVHELNTLRQKLPESTGRTVRHSAFSIAGSLTKLALLGGAIAEGAQYAQSQDPAALYTAGALTTAGIMWDNIYHGAKAIISNFQHRRLQSKIDAKEESLREKLARYQPEARETQLLENWQDNPEVQAMLHDTMKYVEAQQQAQGEKVESLAEQISEESRKQSQALDELQTTLGRYVRDRSDLQSGIDANNSEILALRSELRATQAALDGMSGIKSETGEKLRALEGITEDAKVSLAKTEKALLGARSESDNNRYQEIVNLDAREAFIEYGWPHNKPSWLSAQLTEDFDYLNLTGKLLAKMRKDYFPCPPSADMSPATFIAVVGGILGAIAGVVCAAEIVRPDLIAKAQESMKAAYEAMDAFEILKEKPAEGIFGGVAGIIGGGLTGYLGIPLVGLAGTFVLDCLLSPLTFIGNRVQHARDSVRKTKHKEKFGFEADLEYSNPFVKVVKLPNRKFKNKKAFKDHVYSIVKGLKAENLYATIVLDARDSVIADHTDGEKGADYRFLRIDDDPSTRHNIGIKYHSDAELEDFGFDTLERLANSGIILVNTKGEHYNQINDAEFDANLMTAIRTGTEYMANQAVAYLNFLARKSRAVKADVLNNAAARGKAITQLRTLGESASRTGELMKDYATP